MVDDLETQIDFASKTDDFEKYQQFYWFSGQSCWTTVEINNQEETADFLYDLDSFGFDWVCGFLYFFCNTQLFFHIFQNFIEKLDFF